MVKVNYLLLILPICVNRESCCGTEDLKKLEKLHDDFPNPGAECSILTCAVEILDKVYSVNDIFVLTMQCLYDCIGKKLGYIGTDTIFNSAKYNELTAELSPLSKEGKEILSTCVENLQGWAPAQGDYNDVGLKIEHCLFKEIQMRCPIASQKNESECTDLQTFLKADVNLEKCPSASANRSKFVDILLSQLSNVFAFDE